MVIANALNISQTGLVKFDGITGTFTATAITNHSILIGSANNAITSLPPSATPGIALVSAGPGVDPGFSTVSIDGGGTGATNVVSARSNLGLGSAALINAPIANSDLQNSSITINTSGSLTGGGTVSLGGTLNLNVVPVSSSFLRTFALMGG